MKPDPERIRAIAPRHAAYWQHLRLDHYVGGPFADRTGGLITFEADVGEAERAVQADPFIVEGLVKAHWLRSWAIESDALPPRGNGAAL